MIKSPFNVQPQRCRCSFQFTFLTVIKVAENLTIHKRVYWKIRHHYGGHCALLRSLYPKVLYQVPCAKLFSYSGYCTMPFSHHKIHCTYHGAINFPLKRRPSLSPIPPEGCLSPKPSPRTTIITSRENDAALPRNRRARARTTRPAPVPHKRPNRTLSCLSVPHKHQAGPLVPPCTSQKLRQASSSNPVPRHAPS